MKLEDIITSEVRIKILIELFSATDKHLYVRELTRRVGTEINAVRRELKRLSGAGLIRREKRGNRLYYLLRKDYIFYNELLGMVAKEVGIGRIILDNLNILGKVKLAILSTEFMEGREAEKNELDLLLVGDINLTELARLVEVASKSIGRDVNYTVFDEEEFEYLKSRRDVFLLSFLIAPNILLFGSAEKYLNFS